MMIKRVVVLLRNILPLALLLSPSIPLPAAAVQSAAPGYGFVRTPARSLADTVGIYHWGGRRADGIASGIREVLGWNATIARISLSARMDIDYNRGTSCIPGFNLSSTLDDPDVIAALSDPRLKVVMATVYDGTSFSDCATHLYMNPDFYTAANEARMVNEYSDFVYRLYELFRSSGKRFILANWEGDNELYCGAAYVYVGSEQFREQCRAAYPVAYAGDREPREAVEGLVRWMNARYRGVTLGRQRAQLDGLGGVEILVAAEFTSVHMLNDRGLPSVLYDVIPRVEFDYLSYSCYESLDHGDPSAALTADLDLIRRAAGTDRIILGELGYSRKAMGNRLVSTTQAVTNAAIRWGVAYIIQWNLYDQDAGSDFGLFDLEGHMTELGNYYQKVFSAGPRLVRGGGAPRE